MLKVIPKTIIEKVGNISNLRKVVLKCMEQLYLEQNIINKFTSQEVEHVLNCIIALLHDKKYQI